ncbi:MAG: DUF3145 family protein [Streptosporangiales bacterium]|nr:DUF3145 family protein [Streptosporangiales bacterium]
MCGVLYIHSAPAALCPHVEWAVAGIVGRRVDLSWAAQPAAPGMLRAETCWQGRSGIAAAIASALRGWQLLRFEVTEEPTPGCDGIRYSYTPSLGVFTANVGANGDLLVPENRLRAAMAAAGEGRTTLERELDGLLGRAWDDELEPFRHAGDGAPIRWLHAG